MKDELIILAKLNQIAECQATIEKANACYRKCLSLQIKALEDASNFSFFTPAFFKMKECAKEHAAITKEVKQCADRISGKSSQASDSHDAHILLLSSPP